MRSEAAPAFGVRWLAAFFLAPRPLKRQKEGGKPPYSKSWRCSYPHESSSLKSAAQEAGIAAAYVFIAALVTWPLAANMGGLLPGQTYWPGQLPEGDVTCFLWAFWWFRQTLFNPSVPMDFFNTPLLAHPGGLSLVTTPITPFYALVSVPLQSFLSLTAIYNVFVIFSLAATAYFTYLFARAVGSGRSGRSGPGGLPAEIQIPPPDPRSLIPDPCSSRAIAFLCGCLFGYTSYHTGHWGHLNLLCTQWIPMTLWAVWRGLETRRAHWAALAALGLALEAYSEWYLAVFLLFLLCAVGTWRCVWALSGQPAVEARRIRYWLLALAALSFLAMNIWLYCSLILWLLVLLHGAFLLALLIRRHPARRAHVRNLAVFCILTGALVAPFFLQLWFETRRERTVEDVPLAATVKLSAEPASYAMPQAAIQWIDARITHRAFPDLGAAVGTEYQVFPGYVIWGLCLFVAWRLGRRARQKAWLVIAGVFAVLSWGPGLKVFGLLVPVSQRFDTLILPGIALNMTPFFSGLRVFARFGIIVQFALIAWLAANLGLAIQDFLYRSYNSHPSHPSHQSPIRHSPARRVFLSWALALCIAGAALLERFHAPQPMGPVRPPVGFSELRGMLPSDAAILGLPVDMAGTMMYCQTFHGLRLTNYFGARIPKATRQSFEGSLLFNIMNRFPSKAGERALKSGASSIDWSPKVVQGVQADLSRLGVKAIVIHRALMSYGMEEQLKGVLKESLGWRQTHQTQEFTVYEKP